MFELINLNFLNFNQRALTFTLLTNSLILYFSNFFNCSTLIGDGGAIYIKTDNSKYVINKMNCFYNCYTPPGWGQSFQIQIIDSSYNNHSYLSIIFCSINPSLAYCCALDIIGGFQNINNINSSHNQNTHYSGLSLRGGIQYKSFSNYCNLCNNFASGWIVICFNRDNYHFGDLNNFINNTCTHSSYGVITNHITFETILNNCIFLLNTNNNNKYLFYSDGNFNLKIENSYIQQEFLFYNTIINNNKGFNLNPYNLILYQTGLCLANNKLILKFSKKKKKLLFNNFFINLILINY